MENFDPNEPSKGLGDTVAKITHVLGLDKLADSVANLLGEEDCGCNRRREILNNLVPYSTPTEELDQAIEAVAQELTESPVVGHYEVLDTIRAEYNDQRFMFTPQEKLYIDENHPLYLNIKYYVQWGYLQPIDTTT